jgi:hypothetical protein
VFLSHEDILSSEVSCLWGEVHGLHGLDRVGPLGGQVLGGSATGTFQLQGVLEFSNPVIIGLARRLAARVVVLRFWINGSWGLT